MGSNSTSGSGSSPEAATTAFRSGTGTRDRGCDAARRNVRVLRGHGVRRTVHAGRLGVIRAPPTTSPSHRMDRTSISSPTEAWASSISGAASTPARCPTSGAPARPRGARRSRARRAALKASRSVRTAATSTSRRSNAMVIFDRNPSTFALTTEDGSRRMLYREPSRPAAPRRSGLSGSASGTSSSRPTAPTSTSRSTVPGGVSFFNRLSDGTLTQIVGTSGGCVSFGWGQWRYCSTMR